jgi:hypothetical protein
VVSSARARSNKRMPRPSPAPSSDSPPGVRHNRRPRTELRYEPPRTPAIFSGGGRDKRIICAIRSAAVKQSRASPAR